MTKRDSILGGASRAAELHAELGLRNLLASGDRPVDILEVMRRLGLLVLFRPLKSLLGAYVPTPTAAGVLVTTQRDMHVQRFTAAHELGHHVLQHKTLSLDKDIGFVARGEREGYSEQELEADSFAAEFLLPKWLIVAHARRHKWGKTDLKKAEVVYQLSLRLSASFSATCWALLSNGLIERPTLRHLLDTPPKDCKKKVIPDLPLQSWRRDVWLLSEHDQGTHVLGSPDDILVFALREHVAGGYAWNMDAIALAGLHIEKDDRWTVDANQIGGPVTRRIVAQGAGRGRIHLEQNRAWNPAAAFKSFDINLEMIGAEPEGLPRLERIAA